jgi:hypothetical protein
MVATKLRHHQGKIPAGGQKAQKERSILVPKRGKENNIDNKFRIAFITSSYDLDKKVGERKMRLTCCSFCKLGLTKINIATFDDLFQGWFQKISKFFPSYRLGPLLRVLGMVQICVNLVTKLQRGVLQILAKRRRIKPSSPFHSSRE